MFVTGTFDAVWHDGGGDTCGTAASAGELQAGPFQAISWERESSIASLSLVKREQTSIRQY